ncbi:HAD family hydrolase [soil metagenome]
MDCDGVLTDGRLYFSETGETIKAFHVRDGQGIVMWHEAGFRSGIISGRDSPIVELRARKLGIEFIVQGRNEKVGALNNIAAAAGVDLNEIAYIGDDLPDAPVMTLAGLGVAVADAVHEAREAAHYVTKLKGGHGAVRELVNILLESKI